MSATPKSAAIEPQNSPDTLPSHDAFVRRHIGPNAADRQAMLRALGYDSMAAFIDAVLPPDLRQPKPLQLPPALSEAEALAKLRGISAQNVPHKSHLGMGYYDCHVPAVIRRNLFENPGWYTQYTPYQAEIAQGRLEALLNFQTMVCDLTGLEIANASLLDEATACAEAMALCKAATGGGARRVFLAAANCHPQNLAVMRTRSQTTGIELRVQVPADMTFDESVVGVLLQYPATDGAVDCHSKLIARAHTAGAMVVMATDLLALTLLPTPGELGADIAVGSAQRFGVPMGYGGPNAAFFATRDNFKRHMPGRVVGVSKDSQGKPALRLALQTREQHIRRDKATSNICTAQALLASMAGMYACWHGPEGLRAIALRTHRHARTLAAGLRQVGHEIKHACFFDTLCVVLAKGNAAELLRAATERGINLRGMDASTVGIALDETTTDRDVQVILQVFNGGREVPLAPDENAARDNADPLPRRTGAFLTHPVFNSHHCETQMLRYLKQLEERDLSLAQAMIPLGSCTMKLNAAAEMEPVSWQEFAGLHPFAPLKQTRGYQQLFSHLEAWLSEITGFAGVSLQPNAGSQGEYAGLLVIRAWQEQRGQGKRDVCLIPLSAHGTNPASAAMAGLRVVPVRCNASGDIDREDLRTKAAAHADSICAMMITYPSTHGVFEDGLREICDIVHEHGGQVYLDGANLNALVGLVQPGALGADVCHINLHKTFCIPHGGGGPGMGPIAVAPHLVDFLPDHPVVALGGEHPTGAVSAAPWGSAGILPISWMYIAMMGGDGLKAATETAILSANYIAHRLEPHYPVLYKGRNGRVAHECILDLRHFKKVTVEDVAKRLMDYGFHAPTISWPVAGTMMVEPTESEPKGELDRFCDALIAIRQEIAEVESGKVDAATSMLRHAPHTAEMLVGDAWPHAYTRRQAAFPSSEQAARKFWPPVGRIDNVWGDRNPHCTCAGMESLESAE